MRVLVVDDDKETALFLVHTLQSIHGYTALASHTPEAALSLCESLKPSLIISDLDLRCEISGIELCKKLRARIPTAQIVIITGSEPRELKGQVCDAEKAFPVLQKMLSLDELVSAILKLAGAR